MLCANSGNSGSLGPYIEGVLFFVDNTGSTLLIFLLLLACSAFFSSSETALTKANRVRLKSQEEQGNKAAGRALRLAEEYDRKASETIDNLIARLEPTIVSVLAVAVGLVLLAVMLPLAGVLSSIG